MRFWQEWATMLPEKEEIMYLLNLEGAITAFKNATGVDADYISLPESIDHEKFMLFMRVMRAESPADISDISTTELIALYEHLAIFSTYFGEKRDYLHSYKNELNNKKAVRIRRRVL